MSDSVEHPRDFVDRHVGSGTGDVAEMLESVGFTSLDALVEETIPRSIAFDGVLDIPDGVPEAALLTRLREIASRNEVWRSYLGMGYAGTITPGVIQRNVLENPGWYTQYTPYQAEIAQGRLEALLNFQTAVIDLTGLEIANASLLDEGTAAAEAMSLLHGHVKRARSAFLLADDCHPQTIAVVQTRARPLGIEVRVVPPSGLEAGLDEDVFGVLVQYPGSDGCIRDYRALCESAHEAGAYVVAAADLMALSLLTPPGEFGADLAVGNTQRFGVPMGYGGPHAAYMSCGEEFKRKLPGRIIGVSVDEQRRPALRMALQVREQHIRREKATSNICTAQVLLAVMVGFYAVYHGPGGIRRIAGRIRKQTATLAGALDAAGHEVVHGLFFDTLRVRPSGGVDITLARARQARINLREMGDGTLCVTLDETVTPADLEDLFQVFGAGPPTEPLAAAWSGDYPDNLRRTSDYLTHPVFNSYYSETEMLRYIHRLESRDLSLNTSMIALGSCTMKLNATTQMSPLTWPEFGALHPFAPVEQAQGYGEIIRDLQAWLAEISGLPAVSLQPNSGAQGEYTGLLVIRARQAAKGQGHRNVCLIPSSAHGTNPASAVLAGMQVVVVRCDERGNIDVGDLRSKAEEHRDQLAAIMVTYPSTHGVFEAEIRAICDVVHEAGGYVYLDGANLNAQVGLCRPGDYGADVIHINLHKTFAIPHGGGGPGMGPICVSDELAPYLPGHPVISLDGDEAIGAVSAAPWGSASILLISWAYIALLGADGLKRSTQMAILNANYMASRLEKCFDILYRGENGRVAHEFIVDLRGCKKDTGVTEVDVAKRLMDYGFHAPTMAFPVPGTIMIEPTESESKAELDKFCDTMISIRAEIEQIELGLQDRDDNALKNAPHTARVVTADTWERGYSREQAAYPTAWTREHKFWPHVGRVDNAHGDRNLICSCPPLEAYEVEPAPSD